MTLDEILTEKRDVAVLGALAAVGGNRRRAAAILGMSLRNFLYVLTKMRARGIAVPSRRKVAA